MAVELLAPPAASPIDEAFALDSEASLLSVSMLDGLSFIMSECSMASLPLSLDEDGLGGFKAADEFADGRVVGVGVGVGAAEKSFTVDADDGEMTPRVVGETGIDVTEFVDDCWESDGDSDAPELLCDSGVLMRELFGVAVPSSSVFLPKLKMLVVRSAGSL